METPKNEWHYKSVDEHPKGTLVKTIKIVFIPKPNNGKPIQTLLYVNSDLQNLIPLLDSLSGKMFVLLVYLKCSLVVPHTFHKVLNLKRIN